MWCLIYVTLALDINFLVLEIDENKISENQNYL